MKNKLFSIFTALAMVLGILVAPFTTASAANESTDKDAKTNTVVLHKILQTKENLGNAKFPGTEGLDNTKYDGNKITDLAGYFGTDSKEIKGVYFAWQLESKQYKTNTDGQFVDKQGTVIDENQKDYTKLNDEQKAKLVPLYIKGVRGQDKVMGPDLNNGELQFTENLDEALADETGDNGVKFNTQELKGRFLIQEIHEKSSYFNKSDDAKKKGSVLTDMKAVPVDITLPLVNEKGTIPEAHVYPKNTEDKPKIDKNFDKEKNGTAEGIKETDLNNSTKDNKKDVEIKPDDNQREKGQAPKSVGESVPYKVVTEIPAQTKWATAKWDDKMTEGLTYNDDVALTLEKNTTGDSYETVADFVKNTDYTAKKDGNGFVVEFTEAGLKKINNQSYKQRVTLKYTAKVNDKSVVKVPESNDITFHYGNNPGHGNTPIPTKPKENGELEVEKTWADGVPKDGEWATFTLINANTGKKIGTVKFETSATGTTTTYTAEAGYQAIGNEKPQGPTTKTDTNNVWTFKFTGLDKNLEYKIEEANNMNETAKFTKGTDGQIKIENKKDNNPTPLNPSEPKVITYGARFVKTNADGSDRLAGAEFVIKKSATEFLTGTGADRTAYTTAQTAFETATKAYNDAIKNGKAISADNKVTIDTVEYTDATKAKAKIAELEKARDAAWNATLKDMTQWTGTSKTDTKNIKLTSNSAGQFEIAGLAPGKYTLVEVKAPKDYVDADKATLEFEFEIGPNGELTGKNIDFGAKDEDNNNDNAQQVINKKVSIPQTGGIGSLIFIAAGLAIMTFAFVAYKRSEARA